VWSPINSAVPHKQLGPCTSSHQTWIQTSCHLTSTCCRSTDKTCYFLPFSYTFPLRLGSQSWVPNCNHKCELNLLWVYMSTQVCSYGRARARACGCVCACVRMTGYVFADGGSIIRLWKRPILFHIVSCYPVRKFRPQLMVSLFYLLTNTVLSTVLIMYYEWYS
jgi:hypothetical protein